MWASRWRRGIGLYTENCLKSYKILSGFTNLFCITTLTLHLPFPGLSLLIIFRPMYSKVTIRPVFSGLSHFFAVSVLKIFWHRMGRRFAPFSRLVPFPISGYWRHNLTWFINDQADAMLSNLFPHNCAVSDSLKTHQIAFRILKLSRGQRPRTCAIGRGDPLPNPLPRKSFGVAHLQSSGVSALRRRVTRFGYTRSP